MKRVLPILIMSMLIEGCVSRGHGLHNFGAISAKPIVYFRGARPSNEGLNLLRDIGVKSILDLTQGGETDPDEELTCLEFGIIYHHHPLSGWTPASMEDLEFIWNLLQIMPKPVYVHCVWGSDRTGEVMAYLRVKQGWTSEEALREALDYGLIMPEIIERIKRFK